MEVEIKKRCEEHHIHGAKIAEELLEPFHYDRHKLILIQKCIENHRGSRINEKLSIEEVCVVDGDAISHFDSVPSLFYLAYAN